MPANRGRVRLADRLKNAKMLEFLRLWNDICSLCRNDRQIDNLCLDLDLVIPEVVVGIVGVDNWDWSLEVGRSPQTQMFVRISFSKRSRQILSSPGRRLAKPVQQTTTTFPIQGSLLIINGRVA